LCYNKGMETFQFKSAAELDNFVSSVSGGSLLQTWAWGEVLKQAGQRVVRLGLKENDQIIAATTVVYQAVAPGIFYWFSPRGPVMARPDIFPSLLKAVKDLDTAALFWRIEPAAEEIVKLGQGVKTINLNPAQTLILDLSQSEDNLLQAMHQKTRYNIRLAQKKGVTVKEIRCPNEQEWAEFRRLLEVTGSRDGFRLHAFSHYQNLITSCPDNIRMYTAYYEGQAVATGLFSLWSKQAVYLHGASDNEFRQVMAPYLLQWTVILAAKAAGCLSYDFYGIDDKKWPGVTRFKLGFGGDIKIYPGTWDVVFRPVLYNIYTGLRALRRRL